MIEKEYARQGRDRFLQAFEAMNRALLLVESQFEKETYERMKKAIGIQMGRLNSEFLVEIYKIFPDLDDLNAPSP